MFDDLRENAPSSLDKLVGVAGDVSQDGLGLSDQDVARLSADVSVVFHSAARITFDTDLAQVCVCVCVCVCVSEWCYRVWWRASATKVTPVDGKRRTEPMNENVLSSSCRRRCRSTFEARSGSSPSAAGCPT